ncbi:tripartite tricarboxylate transporter permease [Candidatus Micrarchaeota archaeon]|nr:tripartite tricarboxylate transporter permease [Candidatus Micrarchaeota archaeon]
MEELFVFIFGILIGVLSALIPGLHSNTVISIAKTLDVPFLPAFILAVFGSHLISSYIPSIFFGIPEQGSVLAVLPGQRMVRQGKGIAALKIVLFASILSLLISVSVFYPSLTLFPLIYSSIKSFIPHILILFSSILILRSKNLILSFLVFAVSGMLGYFSLNADLVDPFLPLFSGMFAISAILNYKKSKIPVQKDEKIEPNFIFYVLIGTLFGFFADLLPGVGSASQIATFISILFPINTVGYLATISSVSMSEAVFSFSTAASIDKSRMGATAMLSEQINIENNLLFVIALFLAAVAVSCLIIYFLRKKIGALSGIDFSHFNILIGAYLILISFLIDGWLGVLIISLGALLGWITIKLEVERTMMMGAVIIPTILLLFRIFF